MSEINLIWAEDLNGWIGKDNAIPWHVPADMKFFRDKTSGHPIIMGRNTFISIGRPLPKRKNIILTTHPIIDNRVVTVTSLSELKSYIQDNPADYFIIGGANVYKQVLPLATKLYRTVINRQIQGDTKMPAINYDHWHLVNQFSYEEKGQVICRFEEWTLNV